LALDGFQDSIFSVANSKSMAPQVQAINTAMDTQLWTTPQLAMHQNTFQLQDSTASGGYGLLRSISANANMQEYGFNSDTMPSMYTSGMWDGEHSDRVSGAGRKCRSCGANVH
jgi:hypothetical protein